MPPSGVVGSLPHVVPGPWFRCATTAAPIRAQQGAGPARAHEQQQQQANPPVAAIGSGLPPGAARRRLEHPDVRLPPPLHDQRYKICPYHLELPCLVVEGQTIRFCQQVKTRLPAPSRPPPRRPNIIGRSPSCWSAPRLSPTCVQCGRFQLLTDFEGDRRSCRRKLDKHNERRRKAEAEQKARLMDSGSDSQEGSGEVRLRKAHRVSPYRPKSLGNHANHNGAGLGSYGGSELDSRLQALANDPMLQARAACGWCGGGEGHRRLQAAVLPMRATQRAHPAACLQPHVPLLPPPPAAGRRGARAAAVAGGSLWDGNRHGLAGCWLADQPGARRRRAAPAAHAATHAAAAAPGRAR